MLLAVPRILIEFEFSFSGVIFSYRRVIALSSSVSLKFLADGFFYINLLPLCLDDDFFIDFYDDSSFTGLSGIARNYCYFLESKLDKVLFETNFYS